MGIKDGIRSIIIMFGLKLQALWLNFGQNTFPRGRSTEFLSAFIIHVSYVLESYNLEC